MPPEIVPPTSVPLFALPEESVPSTVNGKYAVGAGCEKHTFATIKNKDEIIRSRECIMMIVGGFKRI